MRQKGFNLFEVVMLVFVLGVFAFGVIFSPKQKHKKAEINAPMSLVAKA
jgi:Tfp pilus assembly protein PilE